MQKKYKGRKMIIQNHYLLSRRIQAMANATLPSMNASEEERKRHKDLEAIAEDHRRASRVTGNTCIMIV